MNRHLFIFWCRMFKGLGNTDIDLRYLHGWIIERVYWAQGPDVSGGTWARASGWSVETQNEHKDTANNNRDTQLPQEDQKTTVLRNKTTEKGHWWRFNHPGQGNFKVL